MGLGIPEQNMIQAIAENDIRKAKKNALIALQSDNTQKNRYFVKKYTSILTSEGSNLFELPYDIRAVKHS